MDEIAKGEIIFGDVTLTYKQKNAQKKKTLMDTVFARKYEGSYPKIDEKLYSGIVRKLDKKNNPLISEMEVVDVKVKARTGFISTSKGFSYATKSSEKRNNITGAYE